MSTQKRYENALIDPSLMFSNPQEILEVDAFTAAQKLAILKRWEQDARELEVAEEEGMTDDDNSLLSEIIRTIDKLDPDFHQSPAAPNKQGNIAE